jgi:hypothetical protein
MKALPDAPITYAELRQIFIDAGPKLPVPSQDVCGIFIGILNQMLQKRKRYGQLPSNPPQRRNAALIRAIKELEALVDAERAAVKQSMTRGNATVLDLKMIQDLHEGLEFLDAYVAKSDASYENINATWHDLARYIDSFAVNLWQRAALAEGTFNKPRSPGDVTGPRVQFVTAALERLGEFRGCSEPLSDHTVRDALLGKRGRGHSARSKLDNAIGSEAKLNAQL